MPVRIIGIAMALIGVVLVTFNAGFSLEEGVGGIDPLGVAFSLMAALSFAVFSIVGKKVLASNDPLVITAVAIFSGAVLLAVLTASTVGFSGLFDSGWVTISLSVFLGLTMIGISYPIWFICLKRLPATHASIYIYLTPVFAVVLSLVILDERFSWLFWVGGILILTGIIITNRFAQDRSIKRKK
jgi:drug/metabolite transporter (DMT)-like permease